MNADFFAKIKPLFGGLLPPWIVGALFLALMAGSALVGAKLNGQRWSAKYERLQHSYESAQAYAQAVATEKTQVNAEQSAQLDKTYYEEYQNATQNTDYWRARYLTERVPSGSKTANCAETRASSGVGNDPATDNSGAGQIDVSRSAIVELREHTDKMRAQVLYFQGKKSVDDVTVDGETNEYQ